MTEGALLLLALVIGAFMEPSPLDLLAINLENILVGLVVTLPLCLLFYVMWKSSLRGLRAIRQLLEETLVPMIMRASIADLALVSLLAGIGEELLFRGVIQLWLHQHIGIWPAIIVASMIFGLAHALTRTYIILATALGIFFGVLMIATDSLIPPIIAHALYDFFGLLFIRHHYLRQRHDLD